MKNQKGSKATFDDVELLKCPRKHVTFNRFCSAVFQENIPCGFTGNACEIDILAQQFSAFMMIIHRFAGHHFSPSKPSPKVEQQHTVATSEVTHVAWVLLPQPEEKLCELGPVCASGRQPQPLSSQRDQQADIETDGRPKLQLSHHSKDKHLL